MFSARRLFLNLVTSFGTFLITTLVNFFLTPFIVRSLGPDAYGFISLGNAAIGYLSLATVALNSMAGRFIAISIYKGEQKQAEQYFSSVLIANVVLSAILLLGSGLVIAFIEHLISVPAILLTQVRLLFSFVVISFCINICTSLQGICFFVKNSLYLQSIRGLLENLIRAACILLLYLLLPPKLYYIGLVAIFINVFTITWNIHYKRRLLPFLRIKLSEFSWKRVKELLSSGLWNVISLMGVQLFTGLDLVFANLFVSTQAMGILAIAKIIPTSLSSVIMTLAATFAPDITERVAKDDKNGISFRMKFYIRLLGLFISIPAGIFCVIGTDFYRLWIPSQDAYQVQILSVLSIAGLCIIGAASSMYDLYLALNKVRQYSIAEFGFALINITCILVLVKVTDLGIYAIAGVSSIIIILQSVIFIWPYGARVLGLKWWVFFPSAVRAVIALVVVLIIALGARQFIQVESWTDLIVLVIILSCISLVANMFVLFTRYERLAIIRRVRKMMSGMGK